MTKKAVKNYFEGVGRRKESIARVRLTPATKQDIVVNERSFETYFQVAPWREQILAALQAGGGKFNMTVKVRGGGTHSQVEAVVHGIGRALIGYEPTLRPALKKLGLLRRDPRAKERRKFGLKKARKAPQWSKR
ncbi:MAG: 30S ribosomal protein S9 [Patescibacteria group bacterium]